MAEFDEFDIGGDDQDKVMMLLVYNDTFLSRCIRKGVEPDLFSSKPRRKFFKIVKSFYEQYKKAPGDDIASVLADALSGQSMIMRDDDIPLIEEYVDRLFSVDLDSIKSKYFIDRIELFMKKRIMMTATNSLMKLKDRFNVDTDRPLSIMEDAVSKIKLTTSKMSVESLLGDNVYEYDRDIQTKWNVPTIDFPIGGGFFSGSFTVIQGYTSRGKSWAATHLAKMATRFGNSVLLAQIEMANKTSKRRIKMSFTGLAEGDVIKNAAETRRIIKCSMLKHSDIFLLSDDEKSTSVDSLPDILDEIEDTHNKRVKLIILDSADDMLPPSGRYRNKIEKSTATYTWLKNFAKDNDICIINTTQTQRIGEKKYWLSTGNVGDDINKMRKATISYSINATDFEAAIGFCRIWLNKNTDGPTGAKVWLRQDYGKGQFVVEHGLYDREEYSEMVKEFRSNE